MARVIRQSSRHSRSEVRGLLQAILTAELVKPSSPLWITSPWISDIRVLDNRSSQFEIDEDWGPTEVPLSKVLVAIATRGGSIVITTTSDSTNRNFIERLHDESLRRGVQDRIVVQYDDEEQLHEKAIIGDDFVLDGSMNLTFSGVMIRRERVTFETAPHMVAAARLEMRNDFGDGR